MKKLIFLLSIFWFGLNFISAKETLPNEDSASNPFYTVNEKNLYMYDSFGDRLDVLKNLDEIRREEDILKLREQIKNSLN